MISDNNYFIFQPLLPEVASGTIYSSDAVTPIRQMLKGIKYRNAEIVNLDFKKKKITIIQGFKKTSHFISYDHLVIALGQISNLEIIKGLKDHSFKMRSLQDAYDLRNNPKSILKQACKKLNISFTSKMLQWPSGPKEGEGVWGEYWYQNVWKTTSFVKQKKASIQTIGSTTKNLYEQAKIFYDKLYHYKINP